MIKKISIPVIILTLAVFTSLFFLTTKKTNQSYNSELFSIKEDTVDTLLQTLETSAWKHLSQAGADKKVVDTLIHQKKKTYQGKRSSTQSLSQQMQNRVYTVLKDFNIHPDSVILVNTLMAHPAWTHQHTIYINEHEMNQLPLECQKWILAHELQHLINQDSMAREILKSITRLEGKTADCPLNELSRFHELRADIHSARKSSDYAHGYYTCMQDLLNKQVKNTGTTHPKLEQRRALAEKILNSFTKNA